MKEYLLNLWGKIKKSSVKCKILLSLLVVLYIGIICVSVIQLDVDATTPGSITNVSYVIDIESENKTGNIYTVSVFTKSKVSIMQYWLMSLDKNTEIELGQSITYDIFTTNEEHLSNVAYKNQSIQDSIIVAYTTAIEEGHDVVLDYKYQGQNLLNIPQNLYKTGSEDIKNNDVIIGYNDNKFESEEDYFKALEEIFSNVNYLDTNIKALKENNKFKLLDENGNRIDENIKLVFDIYNFLSSKETKVKLSIIRDKEEKTINASLKMMFYLYTGFIIKNDKIYTLGVNNYTAYTINYDKCSPKINLKEATTVGPSGGLLQTLAVYNAITKEDITKGLKILGTGGINLKGETTAIGGEQQKVITANLYSADIFFVPAENYESAKEKYDTIEEPTYKLVSVQTFKDVLDYLKNMEGTNA